MYTNTSWLANHVDTKATHAVSVIMQVDQVREEETQTWKSETVCGIISDRTFLFAFRNQKTKCTQFILFGNKLDFYLEAKSRVDFLRSRVFLSCGVGW